MHDSLIAPAAVNIIRRTDYEPPRWLVPDISLSFELAADVTRVTAILSVVRSGDHDQPLRLDGEGLRLISVTVDGAPLSLNCDEDSLTVPLSGATHRVQTVVEISPAANTKLMGLYASSGLLCTQCEAEGFRRITFFPDRPDVLSRYAVRMEADKSTYPVLLCNGDPKGSGDLPDGRHFAEWSDPFPKPSYLFALVAGDLKANRDTFTTQSGRVVDLGIWVAEADFPRL